MKKNTRDASKSRFPVWIIWPGLAAFAVFLAFQMQQSPASQNQSNTAVPSGNRAPAFTLTDIAGATVSLSDLRDKVVILDFWATWCPPCKREIPDFINLQADYGSKGLQIVGIALDQPDKVREFARQNGMNYPVLLGNDQIAAQYGGIDGIPTTFIIDKKGNIVNRFEGFTAREEFEAEIRKLL